MIGVHLRRGDFTIDYAPWADNLANSFRAVDRLIARWPDAGILLCSDDGAADPIGRRVTLVGVHEAYFQHYGSRVVWRKPRSLDRELAGMQDALVDLLLLRHTDAFVGTSSSSFSDIAAYGRHVSTLWAEPDDWRYRLAGFILTRSGIARLIQEAGCRRFGREVTPRKLMQDHVARLRRRLGAK